MTDSTKISPADIEARFRDIADQVDTVANDSKKKAVVAGSAFTILLMLIIYILGKRNGKRSSTVVEIRRL